MNLKVYISRMPEIDDADFVTSIAMSLDVKTAACDRRQTYPPLFRLLHFLGLTGDFQLATGVCPCISKGSFIW